MRYNEINQRSIWIIGIDEYIFEKHTNRLFIRTSFSNVEQDQPRDKSDDYFI